MPKPGYMNVKIDDHLKARIQQAAREDRRTDAGQIEYLLSLGLRVRDRQKEIESAAVDDVAEPKQWAE
jgi:hypothetical protein